MTQKQQQLLSIYYPELAQLVSLRQRSEDKSAVDALKIGLLSKIESVKGEKGDKGDIGETYNLTEQDKKEIASKVEVPIVDKVIEKTEVIIKEKPIVTEITKTIQVENKETAKQVVDKLNTLSNALDISVIKGAVTQKEIDTSIKKIESGMAKVDGRIKLIDQRWGAHGGGMPRVYTDSTLTGTGTASNPLSVVSGAGGGGSGTAQTLLGLIDDSNKTFTFATAITGGTFTVLNGQILVEGVDYSKSGTTVTYVTAPPLNPSGNDTHYIFPVSSDTAGAGITEVNKSTNYTLLTTDNGNRLVATAAITFTVPAVGTLANGFECEIVNDSGGSIVIDGPGSTNVTMGDGDVAAILEVNGKQRVTTGVSILIS